MIIWTQFSVTVSTMRCFDLPLLFFSAQQLTDPDESLRDFKITEKLRHGHFSTVHFAESCRDSQ